MTMATFGDVRAEGVVRIWRGRTRRDLADEYESYNFEEGIRPLIEKARGVQTFRQDGPEETWFMTMSYWESREAMAAFSGGSSETVHHLDRDAELLMELPEKVEIFDLRTRAGSVG
jgi:heme-degrading monooxygenase HmoA